MSFTSARLAEFEALRDPAMYGVLIHRNGEPFYVVSTPKSRGKKMEPNMFIPQSDVTLDMLRSEWIAAGMDTDQTFQIGTLTYIVGPFKDDDIEPTVQFQATKKK